LRARRIFPRVNVQKNSFARGLVFQRKGWLRFWEISLPNGSEPLLLKSCEMQVVAGSLIVEKNVNIMTTKFLSIAKQLSVAMILVGCGGGGDGDKAPSAPIPASISGEIQHAAAANATVYWDTNENWQADPWEVAVTATAGGQYVIAARPSAGAVLRAQTSWLAPTIFDTFDGPMPLSAIKGQESVISPLTSLAQITGTTVAQVESAIGISTTASNSAGSQFDDVARAIALQLRQRQVQLQFGEESDAGQAILFYTKKFIGEVNLSQRALAAGGDRVLPLSTAGVNSFVSSRAWSLPNYTKSDVIAKNVSGFENYSFTTSDQKVIDAVNVIASEMKKNSQPGRSDARGVIEFGSHDYQSLNKWVLQLSAAGLVRDAAEKSWDDAADVRKKALDENFKKSADNANLKAVFLEQGKVLINTDLYVNSLNTVFGGIAFGSGLPVNKAINGVIKRKFGDKTIRSIVEFGRLLNCSMAYIDVAVGEDAKILDLANRLGQCFLDADKKVRVAFVLKALESANVFYDVASNGFEIGEVDPVKKKIAVQREIAYALDALSLIAPDARISGALDFISGILKINADSQEIVAQSQGKLDVVMAAIENSWRVAYKEIERRQWAWKLEYRLNKVISYTPRTVKSGVSVTCSSKPPLSQSCLLSQLEQQSQISLAVASLRSPEKAQAQADSGIDVHVSFGDGWTTDNLSEFVGRAVRPGETLEHAYLTPGRYTVVATTRFPDGERVRNETVVSVEGHSQAEESLRPVIRAVTVSAVLGSPVDVALTISAGGANQAKNARVEVTSLFSDYSTGSPCVLNIGNPEALISGGSRRVSGCTVGANVKELLIVIYAQGTNNLAAIPYRVTLVPTSTAVNGSCGAANGVAATQAPNANLCAAGSASSVSGSGPWSWTCTGSIGAARATCSAPLVSPSNCTGEWDGRTYQVGTVEERFTNTCPVGTTGQVRNFHTCQAGGTWSPLATSDNCRAVLSAPGGASVASVTNGVQVTWNTVAGATGYNVYRDNALLANVSGGLTSSHIDSGVSNGVRYCYAVEATSTFSTPSSTSTRTSAGCLTYSPGLPPLLAPANVQAARITTGGLRISWSLVSGADGYVLTRQNDNSTWSLGATVSSYDDLGVSPGISYAYVVQATRGAVRSPQSQQANAIAPSLPVNGICGVANGVAMTRAPSVNLCSSGSASVVGGAGPWSWTCSGSNGGGSSSCSAPLAVPSVLGFSPKSGARGSTVIVTIVGTGLPDTLALGIPNATCLNRGLFSSGTEQQFNCEISSTAPMGMAVVTVKNRPGGEVLRSFGITQGFNIN